MASRPATGAMTSGFGPRPSPGGIGSTYHLGIDLVGDGNFAPEDGQLISYGYAGGYGWLAQLHGSETNTVHYLAHNRDPNPLVPVFTWVGELTRLAIMGTTGNSTGVHCHWETRPGGGSPIDPLIWLSSNSSSAGGGATPFPTTQRTDDMPTILYRDNDGLAFYAYTGEGAQYFSRSALGDQRFNALLAAVAVYPRINYNSNPGLWAQFDGGPLTPLLEFPLWRVEGTAAKPKLVPITYGSGGGITDAQIDQIADKVADEVVSKLDPATAAEVQQIVKGALDTMTVKVDVESK